MAVFFPITQWANNGSPLNAGVIYTYQTNTTTPLATYTDYTGNTQHTNPVVLDSNGYAQIWMTDTSNYDFVIKTSTGTTLYTLTNIQGVGTTTSALTKAFANIDMNGYSIITNTVNQSLSITPNGTGSTNIKNLVASSGNFSVTSGTIACTGNITSSAGSVSANGTVTAGTGLVATTGGVTATAGGVIITAGNLQMPSSSPQIVDSSSHPLVTYTSTGSAVNNINVTNTATGNGPIIGSTGTDTDITLNFQTKGAGVYQLQGTASTQAKLNIYENTGNGTNKVTVTVPAALAGDTTLTLPPYNCTMPAADGTSGQSLVTNGSGTLSFTERRIALPYISGGYYFNNAFDGYLTLADIIGTVVTNTNSVGTSGTTLAFYPFFCLSTTTFSKLAVQCYTAQASSTVVLGVYAAGSNNQPTGAPLYNSGALSTATTGEKSYSTSISLTGNTLYYLAITCNSSSTSSALYAYDVEYTQAIPGVSTFATLASGATVGYYQSFSYSTTLPSVGSLTALPSSTATPVIIALVV